MSRSEFNRSSKLLQLVFEHVESLTLADLRKSDLNRTRQALAELQTVTTHLREDLNGLIPSVHREPPSLQPESHTEQIVHQLVAMVTRGYATPITLKAAADWLHLSPAYLSTLFTRHVGISFKAYLTTIRLEKARELLGDPRRSISDIACAVGYASENRFRIAFKQATGLSPRAWRETLRIKPD